MNIVPIFFRAYRDGDNPRFIFEIAEGQFDSAMPPSTLLRSPSGRTSASRCRCQGSEHRSRPGSIAGSVG
jgi:hypothetical protein